VVLESEEGHHSGYQTPQEVEEDLQVVVGILGLQDSAVAHVKDFHHEKMKCWEWTGMFADCHTHPHHGF
jgi:hypothetical protein